MRTIKSILFALLLMQAGMPGARAWIPVSYFDPDLVDRSELIVVARVVPGSIKFLPFGKAGYGDHSLVLSITSTLKGQPPQGPLLVLIHYGLSPVVGGYLKEGDTTLNYRTWSNVSLGTIQIFSTNPGMFGGPLTKDAGKDNIWFLRRNDPGYQYDAKNDLYGIFHDQDVQPMDSKPYFEALLSKNPSETLKSFTAGSVDVATRARESSQILSLRTIDKESDPERRATQLASLLQTMDADKDRGALWAVAQSIVKEGSPAAAKLIPAFNDPKDKARRMTILRIWGQTKNPEVGPLLVPVFNDPAQTDLQAEIVDVWRAADYRQSAPMLINLLKKEDQFWGSQQITDKNWWNDINNPICQVRRDSYCRVYGAINALGLFKDQTATDEIKQTRQRWQTPLLDQQSQITTTCDDALKAIGTLR